MTFIGQRQHDGLINLFVAAHGVHIEIPRSQYPAHRNARKYDIKSANINYISIYSY